MNIQQEFLTPNQYTRPQIRLRHVKAIATHYAGDPGATAQNIHDYFNGTCVRQKRYASCHYSVGLQGEIIQLIPESEWSYCTNQANGYTISIETCHPDATGKFTQASEKSLIELEASLCKKYGLNPLNGGVIRHYDVTRKCCPKYYVDHPDVWNKFKQAVADCMAGRPYILPSYGTGVSSMAAAVNPYYCDTSSLTLCPGLTYQFKTGAPITCASDSFKQARQTKNGGYYLTKFSAEKITAGVGFYINGKRVCIGVVKQPYCDTEKVQKALGQTYQFKTDFPIMSANSAIWQQEGTAKRDDKFYYTKFKAVGKGTAGFYCGSTRVSIGTVI